MNIHIRRIPDLRLNSKQYQTYSFSFTAILLSFGVSWCNVMYTWVNFAYNSIVCFALSDLTNDELESIICFENSHIAYNHYELSVR